MTYDIVVLGAGPGGYVAAIHAAKKGARVAVIEQKGLGGVCLHTGCIPTKALIAVAQQWHQLRQGQSRGIPAVSGEIDWAQLVAWKQQLIDRLAKGIETLFDKHKVAWIRGRGTLTSSASIEVESADGKREIQAKNFIIATGSQPRSLKGISFNQNILSSDSLLTLPKFPKSLLIAGGGATGCEMAGLYQMFGSHVTLVEAEERLLPNFDKEISERLAGYFQQRGIELFFKTTLQEIKSTPLHTSAVLSNGACVSAEAVLISIGRDCQIDRIGLDRVGIKTDRGRVVVDGYLRTSVPTIYAVGDVTARHFVAHGASHDGMIAVENILGAQRQVSQWIPQTVFTTPEIAAVGFSEEELKKKGIEYHVHKSHYATLGRAHIIGEPHGWLKILTDAREGKILGVHAIGSHISEFIGEGVMAMELGATLEQLKRVIHPHPTLSEIWTEAIWS